MPITRAVLAMALLSALTTVTAAKSPSASKRAGTVERVIVHGKALEGNLEGDSADRDVTIYEEYDGDHTNRVAERIELNVLPFFSKNLAFAKPRASRATT